MLASGVAAAAATMARKSSKKEKAEESGGEGDMELSVAEKKRQRKERRRRKRKSRKVKHARIAETAEATLMRSRSEATTILLEGLETSEWDLINNSIGGFVAAPGERDNVSKRKEPRAQAFCRWFELVSLTALAVMGILSFAYFGFRCVPRRRRASRRAPWWWWWRWWSSSWWWWWWLRERCV